MERERYDGADVAHLLRAGAPHLNWLRLFGHFGPPLAGSAGASRPVRLHLPGRARSNSPARHGHTARPSLARLRHHPGFGCVSGHAVVAATVPLRSRRVGHERRPAAARGEHDRRGNRLGGPRGLRMPPFPTHDRAPNVSTAPTVPHPDPPGPSPSLPFGAELQSDGSTHFRVWAPARHQVEVVLERAAGSRTRRSSCLQPMTVSKESAWPRPERDIDTGWTAKRSYIQIRRPATSPRDRTARQKSSTLPHSSGPIATGRGSRCSDRSSTRCTSARLRVKGRYASAVPHLPGLAELGITVIELMPVAEFAGRFGWGYDGVDLYAPTRCTDDLTICDSLSIEPTLPVLA